MSDLKSTSLLQLHIKVIKMQPFCQNSLLSRSLESELENAVKTGELKLSAKHLKDFPKHGERYNLQDTIIAGTFILLQYYSNDIYDTVTHLMLVDNMMCVDSMDDAC